MVAWCLTLCSPTPEAGAASTTAHCALHDAGEAAAQVTTRGMEGCPTAHDAGYGLVDARSPDDVVRLSAPAVVLLTLDLAPVRVVLIGADDATSPVTATGRTHPTPLRL